MQAEGWSVLLVVVLLLSAIGAGAQEPAASVPEGWGVSPQNTTDPGEAGFRILQ